jgi:prepilin-type N-terminal cleavage/methylation domain-containing protein
MKKQTGFTLIELLLVLAIIGIISAIAIPALLGQRARSRDKSAQSNATGILTDIISANDKAREAGLAIPDGAALYDVMTTVVTPLPNALCPQVLDAKNPWFGTGTAPQLAYADTFAGLTGPTETQARADLGSASGNMGQVQMGFLAPNADDGTAGACGTSVWLQGQFNDTTGTAQNIFAKVGNLE